MYVLLFKINVNVNICKYFQQNPKVFEKNADILITTDEVNGKDNLGYVKKDYNSNK